MGVAAIGAAHRGIELHPEIIERCSLDGGCVVAMRRREELEEDVGEHLVVGGLGAPGGHLGECVLDRRKGVGVDGIGGVQCLL